ncbi:MAG: zinc-finger domain-containing protein [bacterium]|nr:zinc-finger domain-containing protein [bacterium]
MVKDEEKPKTTFDIIGKRWRESVDKVKEYEIIESEEEVFEEFIPSNLFGINYQEYQEAEKLKQKLLKKYKGKILEEVIVGEELVTKKGSCYHIKNQDRFNLKTINPDRAREKILSNLKLIYGIGEVTERILKEEGYKTIEDLTEHPRFGSESIKFLKILNKRDTCQIVDWIAHWLPKSHPLILYSSGLHDKKDFLIFDIETMGLFARPIILFGIARVSGDQILINQYLLRDIKEEPAALMAFLSHINEDNVFITFNGRTFDIPYVRDRLAYYRMEGDLEKPHFDMLHFSRYAWKEQVPNCRLTTLEKHLLGIERQDDVPSALVPEFYETYMKTKNVGPLIPIIEHNKQDLVTLAKIFSELIEYYDEEGHQVNRELQKIRKDCQGIFNELDKIVGKYCSNCNLYNLFSSKISRRYPGVTCIVRCPVNYDKIKEKLNSMDLPSTDLNGVQKMYFRRYIKAKLEKLSCPDCKSHSINLVLSKKTYKCKSCGWNEDQFAAYLKNYPFEEKVENQYVIPVYLGYDADCKHRLQQLQLDDRDMWKMLQKEKKRLGLPLEPKKEYIVKPFGKMNVIYKITNKEGFEQYLKGYYHY